MRKPLKHRNLALLLLQARECVMVNFRRILLHHGLTEQQWRVLRAIDDSGRSLEQWEICETCKILSPSLAGVLARMDALALIERTRVDADQRRIGVSLTDKSRALIKQIAPLVERQYQHLEAGIGPEVVEHLYQALDSFLARQDAPIAQVDLEEKKPAKARGGRKAGGA